MTDLPDTYDHLLNPFVTPDWPEEEDMDDSD